MFYFLAQMIPSNFKTGGANVALEKKVVAQKDVFLAQTDLSLKKLFIV